MTSATITTAAGVVWFAIRVRKPFLSHRGHLIIDQINFVAPLVTDLRAAYAMVIRTTCLTSLLETSYIGLYMLDYSYDKR
jgi:hypothetical protein